MHSFRASKFHFSCILSVLILGLVQAEEQSLEPMVVSALRLETSSKNLPARIHVIDADKIEKSGSTDLVGLLRKEANLQVRSYSANSARASISMGGFGENGGLRTLVLLDGHRLNAIDMSAIDWYSIPLSLVDSIEVIRGAQSGTYGNHAVGGVIKINTKLPKLEPAGSLEASAGSFDSHNVKGAYSQRIGEIGLTIFGERGESDGYRVNGDHQIDVGGLRLDWGGGSDFRGYLSWSLSNSEFGLPGSLDASQLLTDRRQAGDPNNMVEERSSYGRAGLSYEINDNLKLENRFGYQGREVTENTPDWGWSPFTSKEYKSSAFSPSLHYKSNDTDWMFGFDLTEDERKSSDNSEFKKTASAVLASTLLPISNQLNLNGNFRLERAKFSGDFDRAQNEWAAGIGLIRDFGNEDRVYGTIRRFYRYPVTDEYYSVWTGFEPDLVPENGYEVEFGLDWNIGKVLSRGRVFWQRMEGEIMYDNFRNRNLPKNRRVGLDLSLDWQMTKSIHTGLSYEYVRATFEDGTYSGSNYSGSRVPLVPEGLLRLFIELRPIDSFFLSVGASYVGKSFYGSDFQNTGSKMEDYWLYDLSMNYEFSETASLFGGIDNLLDEEYLSSSFAPSTGYPGEGRNVRAGLRFSF
jgi:outer membrane cobalamin receptor